jgi:enoyl-CoA hydratase/carnithine racemase
MHYRTIAYEKHGAITKLTLARHDGGNRLDEAALTELGDACRRAADDAETRVVTLEALGDAFCLGWQSGMEAKAMLRLAEIADGFSSVAQILKPTIAVLQGDAISAGLELSLACDMRLASESAHFGLTEVADGRLPMAGGTQRLPRLIGRAKALEMVLTAESIDANEALACGLVNRVVPSERLAAEAEALARSIAERGPIAAAYAKEAVLRGLDMPLDQALRLENELTIILQTTEDRAEGVRAFLEKRQPRFHGR